MVVRGRVERTYMLATPLAGLLNDAPAINVITEGGDY